MIRSIRVLGAALGGLIGIVLVTSDATLFRDVPGAGALIVAWLIAWATLGFSLLPYLTVVPAVRVVRGVQELSTAEFVTDRGLWNVFRVCGRDDQQSDIAGSISAARSAS